MNNKEYKNLLIQRVFDLSRKTIALTDKFPKKRSAWVITDQLIRAITSIGANIIEAQAASSNKDFMTSSHNLTVGVSFLFLEDVRQRSIPL